MATDKMSSRGRRVVRLDWAAECGKESENSNSGWYGGDVDEKEKGRFATLEGDDDVSMIPPIRDGGRMVQQVSTA